MASHQTNTHQILSQLLSDSEEIADTGMGLMELLLLKWFSNIDLVVWRQFSQGPPTHLPQESPYSGANVATELFSATARL